MGRLNIEATTRWSGVRGNFGQMPIVVMMSVTDETGAPVTGLQSGAVTVRYLTVPTEGGSLAGNEHHFFEQKGGVPMTAGFYSFTLAPWEDEGEHWIQDQVFLFITVRSGGNRGQALCLATYHEFGL